MKNPNLKLRISVISLEKNTAEYTLYKGAKLDASVINPKQIINLNCGCGFHEEATLEDMMHSRGLKSVMGECTNDITGVCDFKKAVKLIRALHPNQEAELVICQNLC